MRALVRGFLAVLLVALVSSFGLVAVAAEQSNLQAEFEARSGRVTADGTLTNSQGDPIRGAEVIAAVDGSQVATARVRGNGRFQITIPIPDGGTPGKTYRIEVSFPGNDDYSASSALADYSIPGGNSGEGSGGRPTSTPTPPATSAPPESPPTRTPSTTQAPPPPPAPKPAVLTVNPLPASVTDSSTLGITGTLKSAAGQSIGGAGIVVSDTRGEVVESYTVTSADGSFSTLYEVPSGMSGPLRITLSFAGMTDILGVNTSVSTVVDHTEVMVASPTPTPSATPSATAEATAEASASPSVEATTPPVDAALPGQPWFLASLIGVGGIALLTVGALVFRGVTGARPEAMGRRSAESGGLDFLDQELDADDD